MADVVICDLADEGIADVLAPTQMPYRLSRMQRAAFEKYAARVAAQVGYARVVLRASYVSDRSDLSPGRRSGGWARGLVIGYFADERENIWRVVFLGGTVKAMDDNVSIQLDRGRRPTGAEMCRVPLDIAPYERKTPPCRRRAGHEGEHASRPYGTDFVQGQAACR